MVAGGVRALGPLVGQAVRRPGTASPGKAPDQAGHTCIAGIPFGRRLNPASEKWKRTQRGRTAREIPAAGRGTPPGTQPPGTANAGTSLKALEVQSRTWGWFASRMVSCSKFPDRSRLQPGLQHCPAAD